MDLGRDAQGCRRKARSALLWGFALLLALQAAWVGWLTRKGILSDLEYDRRVACLRQLIADHPDKPLTLVLGSSRTMFGIRPSELAATQSPISSEPIVFNFSVPAAGPLHQLLYLRRLIREGIRPHSVVVECWTACLSKGKESVDASELDLLRLSWLDLAAVEAWRPRGLRIYRDWFLSRLSGIFSTRKLVLDLIAPRKQPRFQGRTLILEIDHWGWNNTKSWPTDSETRRRMLDSYRSRYGPAFAKWELSEACDRALSGVLALCREREIRTVLLFMPESPEFRTWYPPGLRERLNQYLVSLAREHSTPLIDIHEWLQEPDFYDGFHCLPESALRLTKQLERTVLAPYFTGQGMARFSPDAACR